MTDDLSLFGDEPSADESKSDAPLSDSQVDALRQALDALGLVTMEARKKAIEDLAYRPVPNLRALGTLEARVILDRLRAQATETTSTSRGSSWDNREGDTWIDRL